MMKSYKQYKVNEALSYLTEEDIWQKKFYDRSNFRILTDEKISKDLTSIWKNREIIFCILFLILGLFLSIRGLFYITSNENIFGTLLELLLGLSICIVSYKFAFKTIEKIIIIKKGYWFCENVSVIERYIQNITDRQTCVIKFSNNKSVFVTIDNYEEMLVGFECYYISFDKEKYFLDTAKDINIEFDFAYYRKDKFKYIGTKLK